MPDAKYGRLFTEHDVRSIVDEVLCLHAELLGLSVDEVADKAIERAERDLDKGALTFPADEPLFLLRGQDAAAPNAIARGAFSDVEAGVYGDGVLSDYLQSCLNRDAPHAHLRAIWEGAAAMRDWQREYPDRVKVPD